MPFYVNKPLIHLLLWDSLYKNMGVFKYISVHTVQIGSAIDIAQSLSLNQNIKRFRLYQCNTTYYCHKERDVKPQDINNLYYHLFYEPLPPFCGWFRQFVLQMCSFSTNGRASFRLKALRRACVYDCRRSIFDFS